MKADYFRYEEELREAFEDFKVRPPASVWYGIVDELPAKAPRKKIPQVWLVAASVALFLASTVFVWIYSGRLNLMQGLVALQQQSDYGDRLTDNSASTTLGESVLLENTEQQPQGETPSGTKIYQSGIPSLSSEGFTGPPVPVVSLDGNIATEIPSLALENAPDLADNSSAIQVVSNFETIDLNQPEVSRTRIDLGGHFAMRYSSRSLTNSPTQLTSNPLKGIENPIMTFDAGISLTLSSKSRLSFQTGVHYSTMGQYVNNIDVFSNPELLSLFKNTTYDMFGSAQTMVTSHGFIQLNETGQLFSRTGATSSIKNSNALILGESYPLSLNDFGLTQMFSFIEVPLIARFRMLDHGLTMHMKGGVSASYMVSNNVFPSRGSVRQSIGETFGIRQLNFEGIVGVVVDVPITRNISFQLEPTAQFFFFPMIDGFNYFGRPIPYSFSLFTGITYGF
ncbi:MAG TPA: hypothetical protein VLH37_06475 [Bacteroidales bacterium]|nr:hypothetical protein [Bacteroidales bacterium]